MSKITLDDGGFYLSSRKAKFKKWWLTSDGPMLLIAVGCLAVIGACAVALVLMDKP